MYTKCVTYHFIIWYETNVVGPNKKYLKQSNLCLNIDDIVILAAGEKKMLVITPTGRAYISYSIIRH